MAERPVCEQGHVRWWFRMSRLSLQFAPDAGYDRQFMSIRGLIRKSLRQKTNLANSFNRIAFVGLQHRNFSLSLFRKSCLSTPYPASPKGAYRDRHERGGGMRWACR